MPHHGERRLTVKAYPDRVCIYCDTELIARHQRSYARHQDIEDEEHVQPLVAAWWSSRKDAPNGFAAYSACALSQRRRLCSIARKH